MGRERKSAKARADESRHLKRLGQHLKELREEKNLTPADLADKLGVTPQYIYMIEAGRAKPSERRLNELAGALGDLADEFLSTAVERVEDEFAARLKEAGLSPEEIDEAARRVSARVKENVVLGKEPLRVARSEVPQKDYQEAMERGEEIVAMDTPGSYTLGEKSASDYARSVKDQFGAVEQQNPRRRKRTTKTYNAGPYARIAVRKPLTPEQEKAIEDIGRVIAHLLHE